MVEDICRSLSKRHKIESPRRKTRSVEGTVWSTGILLAILSTQREWRLVNFFVPCLRLILADFSLRSIAITWRSWNWNWWTTNILYHFTSHFSPANHCPPFHHTVLLLVSSPTIMCDTPNQTAHYHILGLEVGGLISEQHLPRQRVGKFLSVYRFIDWVGLQFYSYTGYIAPNVGMI